MQAAGADAGKIGHQHIVFGPVFDAAEKRAEQRIVFHDHRRTIQAAVVYDQVDAVARQYSVQSLATDFLVGIGNLEQFKVFHHVMHHLIEIYAELDRILDLLLQLGAYLLQLVIQQRLHHLAAQRRQRFVHRPLHGPGLLEITGNLRAQFLLGLGDLGAALLGQCKNLILGIGAPFFTQQREKYVSGFAVHRKTAGFGESLEFGIGFGLFRFVGLFDALAFDLEILPVQTLRYFRLQRFRHLCHQLPQQPSLPGRQAQRARSFRRIEVVQIAQIGRHRFVCGACLHRLLEQRRAPAADLAQHKQVVIRLVHAESEACRHFRAFLPNPRQRIFQQFRSIGESQRIGNDGEAQLGGRQFQYRHVNWARS